jgi:hypothetical protein
MARMHERYRQDVLAPALGEATHDGLQAPTYVVRSLSDTLVYELLRGGHARLVVQAGAAFFLGEETDGVQRFQRIAELPGYARRALLLRSAFSQAIAQTIRREPGYAEAAITVLCVPSAALDRLILAKQTLAARQLNTSLAEVRLTEGRLVRHGSAFTFLVERVVFQQGTSMTLEDSEGRFVTDQ